MSAITIHSLPQNFTSYGFRVYGNRFDGNHLALTKDTADLVLPLELITIGIEAFEGVSAESIYLQDKTTEIQENAFANCSNLRAIHIPSAVTSIADSAFAYCSNDLVFYGASTSKAFQYATGKRIPFVVESN